MYTSLTSPKACILRCYAFWQLTIRTSALWKTGSARSRSRALMPYWGGCFLQTSPRITLPNSSKKVNNFMWSKWCSFQIGWNITGLEVCRHLINLIIAHLFNENVLLPNQKKMSSFTKIPLSLFYSIFRAAWKSHPADADLRTFNTSLGWRIDPVCRSVDIKYEPLAERWSPSADSSDCQ